MLCGVVAAFVSFTLSFKKDQFIFKQKKAEELYISADRYTKDLFGSFLYFYPYMKGETTHAEAQESIVKSNNGSPNDSHPKLWMLTRFYFPEILPRLLALDDARSVLVKLTDRRREPDFKQFHAATGVLNDTSTQLLDAIVNVGQRYAEPPSAKMILVELRRSYLGR